MAAENRHYPRVKESCRIRYKVVQSNGILGPGTDSITVNISGGGICFEVSESVDSNAILAIELTLADFDSPVVSLGRVAWCEAVGPERFEIGMEFWWVGWGDDGAQKAMSEHIKTALKE